MEDDLFRWLPVDSIVVQAVMGWGLWSLKQQFVSRRECDDCRKETAKKVDKADDRINDIDSDVGKLPERHELTDLSSQIVSLTEKLGKLDGRLAGINRAVDLLNQHHLRVGA